MSTKVAHTARCETTEISWDPTSRIAFVRYAENASLTGKDGVFLAETLLPWVGADRIPFAILADGTGLRGTDGDYRAKASAFFREHRDRAFIALVNLGPVISVVVELFRLGTGIPLKACSSEADAREWLRSKGIAA